MNSIKKDLFDLFQLDKMPREKAEEMLERLAKLVFQAVLVRSLPLLNDEDLKEYERITSSEEEDGDALFVFLNKKVPEFSKIVTEEVWILRKGMEEKIG